MICDKTLRPILLGLAALVAVAVAAPAPSAVAQSPAPANSRSSAPTVATLGAELEALRLAVKDLHTTFGPRYPNAPEYLAQLAQLEETHHALAHRDNRSAEARAALGAAIAQLRQSALLANPLLDFEKLLLIRRRSENPVDYNRRQQPMHEIGLPTNHLCNSSLPRTGYDNQIAVLSSVRPGGRLTTLYRPQHDGYVGEIDLHFDGRRLLLAQSDPTNWKILELQVDGTGLRQVSQLPDDVDAFDPCYLPNERIVFGSTASFQAVPCWSGMPHRVTNLYLMDADGGHVRQLCYDQDHDLHPTLRNDGQVMFTRWDYTGIRHEYLRILMTMNPDGRGQRALYGSNSWWPNALYFTRPIPGDADKLIGIVSDYHGVPRMGALALFDTSKGWHEADGVVQLIPGRGQTVDPVIKEKNIIGTWPLFLHPFPLSEKYFLVACRPSVDRNWGIYLADVFDNLVLIREEPGWALLEPIPLRATRRPPVIPDQVDLADTEATIYLHDVYHGPGLQGVPRGTVRQLRLFSYHFGYPGLAGSSRIGIGGPWEVNRILGTVPVEADGSALFRVPANTPISLQPLDAEGKAVQVMRSWYTAMPGERVSCVGCHERQGDTPRSGSAGGAGPGRYASLASQRPPHAIRPWYGPARGFDFEREIQPVLDRHCVSCHNGQPRGRHGALVDLRARRFQPGYQGWPIGQVEPMTLNPVEDVRRIERVIDRQGPYPYAPVGRLYFTPAYEALFPLVRRVDIEDAVDLPLPGEFHADTSRLMQLLRLGHHGVQLDAESWDRLITWIDLNAPCHGTWGDVYPIPGDAHLRRMQLRAAHGGPTADPEAEVMLLQPAVLAKVKAPAPPPAAPASTRIVVPGWPFDATEAKRRQMAEGAADQTLTLGEGLPLKLVRIPAGTFIPGGKTPARGQITPAARLHSFWLSVGEITNRQFQAFNPSHDSGYSRDFRFRLPVTGRQGRALNEPDQPAVRVSWEEAMQFCAWVSQRTGWKVTLPTETEWEYACRAGTVSTFWFGEANADFSRFANLADQPLWGLGNPRCNDGAIVTSTTGHYQPNPWGLFDMHGNAAEWTLTADEAGRRIVRGGSFYDGPAVAASAAWLAYPAWQRVHNVGFRILCSAPHPKGE
jgi:formylglycine-generating enzyme required for sulfatase activity